MCYLLARRENLESRDEVCHRNGLVVQPLLVGFVVINEDDEVLGVALVVDLDLGSLAFRHVDGVVVV